MRPSHQVDEVKHKSTFALTRIAVNFGDREMEKVEEMVVGELVSGRYDHCLPQRPPKETNRIMQEPFADDYIRPNLEISSSTAS